MLQLGSAAVGLAVGGGSGAVTALDGTQHNYLTHQQRDQKKADVAACGADQECVAQKQQYWDSISANQDLAMGYSLIEQGALPSSLADQLRSTVPNSGAYTSLLSQAVGYSSNVAMNYALVTERDGDPGFSAVLGPTQQDINRISSAVLGPVFGVGGNAASYYGADPDHVAMAYDLGGAAFEMATAGQWGGGQKAIDVAFGDGLVRLIPGASPDANELSAGQGLAKQYGYSVAYQPTASSRGVVGQRTADLVVNGIGQVDVYTPQSSSPTSIARGIESKVGQAQSVLVQADLSSSDMSSVASRTWGKPGTQSIQTLFFQQPDGTITRFDRPSAGK